MQLTEQLSTSPTHSNHLHSGIHESHLRHTPTYSINGILGIHQADANDNLMKRKREDEGKRVFYLSRHSVRA